MTRYTGSLKNLGSAWVSPDGKIYSCSGGSSPHNDWAHEFLNELWGDDHETEWDKRDNEYPFMVLTYEFEYIRLMAHGLMLHSKYHFFTVEPKGKFYTEAQRNIIKDWFTAHGKMPPKFSK